MDLSNIEEIKLNLDYGHVDENGEIVREYTEEGDTGYVYRSEEAFNKKEGICYININGDKYSYADFLEAAHGNEDIARGSFEMQICTWNTPQEYIWDGLEEDIDFFVECYGCGYIYDHNEEVICPKCHTPSN